MPRLGARFRAIVAGGATAVAVLLGALADSAAPAAPVPAGGPPVAGQVSGPAAAPAPWAPAGSAPIRPGVLTETAGGGACTSNFVFTGGGRVFLGQAAHCAATGAATETDGCTSSPLPLGTPVTVRAADGRARTGTVAYSSWVSMQATGEADPATCASNDFALVALAPGDAGAVNPSVPFFGGPRGLDADVLPAGEEVFGYGGVDALRPRVGVSAGDAPGGWAHEVFTVEPGAPGDSGSGFLDADGGAVGLLTTLNLGPEPVSSGVTDLARALAYARAHGAPPDLALEAGTEPFTTAPPGIPATDLAPPAGPPLG
ncbi:MAG TPA: serine protease [Pseudonocardia sp.]|nr:serine protease [Pseudonocardia sp.]